MPQTILIIDDAIPQHNLVKIALEGRSITFHSAFTGVSGLSMAASLEPDLILLDVDMPEMNGFDVCRLLKANLATRDIPVIFLTSAASMDERICGFDVGAIDYITKPFDHAELLARVLVAFRSSQIRAGRSVAGVPLSPPLDREGGCDPLPSDRLSMAQRTQWTSENPWNRVAPATADSTPEPLGRDGMASEVHKPR